MLTNILENKKGLVTLYTDTNIAELTAYTDGKVSIIALSHNDPVSSVKAKAEQLLDGAQC